MGKEKFEQLLSTIQVQYLMPKTFLYKLLPTKNKIIHNLKMKLRFHVSEKLTPPPPLLQ